MSRDRREEIVQAARDLFLAQGVEGVSMRKVARAVGISAPAIYRHFEGKDALIAAVVSEGRRLLAASLFQALEGQDPRERLWLTGLRYLDFAFEHPEYYKVFFMSWDRLDPEVHGQVVEAGGDQLPPAMQFVFDRVRECLSAGLLPEEREPMTVVLWLWSQCHGLAALYLVGGARHRLPLDQYRALCLSVLSRAMGALFDEAPSG